MGFVYSYFLPYMCLSVYEPVYYLSRYSLGKPLQLKLIKANIGTYSHVLGYH